MIGAHLRPFAVWACIGAAILVILTAYELVRPVILPVLTNSSKPVTSRFGPCDNGDIPNGTRYPIPPLPFAPLPPAQ